MVGQTINVAQLRRELSRFCDRIGMKGVPQFEGTRALVFSSGAGRLGFELNEDHTALLVTYAVKPDLADTDRLIRRALELSRYNGGLVVNAMYVDPYLMLMTKIFNMDVSAEAIENVLMQLIRAWEGIKHGD